MAKPPSRVDIVPAPYDEVVALLKSSVLAKVEEAIAEAAGYELLRDLETTTTSAAQQEISISGMSPSEIEDHLRGNDSSITRFGIAFLADDEASGDDEPDEDEEVLGLGTGFGITYAIYHAFLAHRTAGELRAFLKQRRIPGHTKFARELARVYEDGPRDE